MKIVIDCGKLSEMEKWNLKTCITDTLRNGAYRITQDLLSWPDHNSQTYKSMEGWSKAAMDEYHSVLKQFKEG
jgi:hypothetical protein